MATVTYHPQSFLFPFWQNVIDFNASLISIPLGTVSGTLSGFAFENVDGTYTIFLGTDIVVGENAPISGTVTEIVRRSTLDPFGVHYADITGSFPATGVYEAFRGGGTEFFASVLSGGDLVEIDSPASLGPLAQSPLIETYQGNDFVPEASTPIPSTRAGATIQSTANTAMTRSTARVEATSSSATAATTRSSAATGTTSSSATVAET